MNTKFVLALNALLRDLTFNVKIANALDRAYNELAGTPDSHKPFSDEPSVLNNLPGFHGAIGAATAIAAYREGTSSSGRVSAEGFETALRDMASGNLDEVETTIARTHVNATWRLRNATRNFPDRLGREINRMIFVDGFDVENLEIEIKKDDYQWQTAAKVVVEEIDSQS